MFRVWLPRRCGKLPPTSGVRELYFPDVNAAVSCIRLTCPSHPSIYIYIPTYIYIYTPHPLGQCFPTFFEPRGIFKKSKASRHTRAQRRAGDGRTITETPYPVGSVDTLFQMHHSSKLLERKRLLFEPHPVWGMQYCVYTHPLGQCSPYPPYF